MMHLCPPSIRTAALRGLAWQRAMVHVVPRAAASSACSGSGGGSRSGGPSSSWTWDARAFGILGAAGGACAALVLAATGATCPSAAASTDSLTQTALQVRGAGVRRSSKPGREVVFDLEDVAKHNTRESCLVTYKDDVYDVTEFVDAHPGGADRIMMAAGAAVDPFWAVYQQHLTEDVQRVLAGLRVGRLSDAAVQAREDARKTRPDPADPYGAEPLRHPALVVRKQKPFNAETPMTLLAENFVTPSSLWYVRHHHPVPQVDPETFRLEAGVEGAKKAAAGSNGTESSPTAAPLSLSLSLQDLWDERRFPRATVTSTIQCAGNRRSGLNAVKKTQGLDWDCGAVGTAVWRGVWLRDVLRDAGIADYAAARRMGLRHVQFLPLDPPYDASIPIKQALDPDADVLLALEMNGQVLPREHGYPVRVIVPGSVGARNVKWVGKIVASSEEAHSTWQRGVQYRGVSPNVTTFKGLDPADPARAGPPVHALPIQSAICQPAKGTTVDLEDGEVDVKGFAWAGNGRRVVRVDVSADGGHTWHTAGLREGTGQESGRAWAWTLWSATVPLPEAGGGEGGVQLVCRAVDEGYNVQPDHPAALWNLRGILNNSWHRVDLTVSKST